MTRVRAEGALGRGRDSVRQQWRDARDRFVASDPGLTRLRHGTRAVVATSTTVVLQAILSTAAGAPRPAALMHVMIGGIVALNLATTLKDTRRRAIVTTASAAAGGAVVGAASSVLADPWRPVALTVFVAVTFLAVWVRRFGPRWFTAGFVMWQAHFFGLFLHPPASALPGILLAAVISTAWVGLLLVTILARDPEATLQRTVTALRAQARSVLSACLDVLADPASESARRALRAHLIKTSEVALLFDGQLADARALPEGVSPLRLRQWIIDLEIGVDEVAGAVVELADRPRDDAASAVGGTRHTEMAMRRALTELGWSRFDEARMALAVLRQDAHWGEHAARRFVLGGDLLLTSVEDWNSGTVLEQARAENQPGYQPVVQVSGDALPGSAALAGKAVALDAEHWWSPGRMAFTTRQAIQAATAAALALLLGDLISPGRSYWAAIAAFVTFTGASTTSETTRKAIDRTVGTLVGLVVSIGLAHVTGGQHVVAGALMLLGIFLAFYVQALSTTWMICLITIVLGQLYELLRDYTEHLLWIRLAETAAGAAAGIFVTYAVLPVASGDTLVLARRQLLTTLADLLERVGGAVRVPPSFTDRATIYREVVALDEAARQLASAHDSLIRPRVFDADHAGRRHRVAVLVVCASAARSLVQAALALPADPSPVAEDVCRALAAEARRLADVPDLKDQRPTRADAPGIAGEIAEILSGTTDLPVVFTRRCRRLADALGLLSPRAR
ncbi:FUSC family protein [Nostocoides vanveenii]